MSAPPLLPALFGVAPIGRGTAGVESLTSYLARLSFRRSLRPLDAVGCVLRHHAPPEAFAPRGRLASFLNDSAARFDSVGPDASTLVAALESATMRRGLASLTMLPFLALFAESKSAPVVVARHRRWCPACFAAWEAAGVACHEPLLWRLRAVERCSVHGLALRARCPRCGSRQGAMAMRVSIGVCRVCGHPLYGDSDCEVPALDRLEDDDRWAVSRARAVGRMLEAAQSAPSSRDGFGRLLAFALPRGVDDASALRRFSCAVGVSAASLRSWLARRSFPPLGAFVDVSLQLGADPAEVVLCGFDPRRRRWPPRADPVLSALDDPWAFALRARERASERRHPGWAERLDALGEAPLPSGLHGLAKSFGTSRLYLRTSFPLRFARLREARAEHRAAAAADARERARVALERAIAAGGAVTAFQAGRWAGVSEASLGEHWPVLYRRLRALVDARVVSNDPDVVARGEAALSAALAVPGGLTAAEVARSLGFTPSILLCACPVAYRKLVDLRAEERRAKRAAIRAGLEAEIALPAPRGTVRLARALGACLADLQREGDLFARLMAKRRGVEEERSREAQRKRAERAAVDAARRALIERVDAALRAEFDAPSPRSPRAVAVAHGTDAWFARRHCRAAYTALLDLRRARV